MTSTAALIERTAKDNFTQVYHFTLSKLHRSEEQSTATVLHILNLLLQSEQHAAVYALDLWLFCEVRKIWLNTKNRALQRKTIQENIVQRFIAQSDVELQVEKMIEIQKRIQNILQKMGCQV